MLKKRPYKPLTREQQRKAKLYRERHKRQRKPHLPTVHDLTREIYKAEGAQQAFKYKRVHATDLQRLLTAGGLDARLADFMTTKEQLVEKAALTGLRPGRIALTLPERLVIGWLEDNHYSFGGVFPNIVDTGADFFSQYPLGGGRSHAGGGLVADVFISSKASRTDKGIVLAVDGAYYHGQASISGRDEAQNLLMRSEGFVVARIRDNEVYAQGVLNTFMHNLLGSR